MRIKLCFHRQESALRPPKSLKFCLTRSHWLGGRKEVALRSLRGIASDLRAALIRSLGVTWHHIKTLTEFVRVERPDVHSQLGSKPVATRYHVNLRVPASSQDREMHGHWCLIRCYPAHALKDLIKQLRGHLHVILEVMWTILLSLWTSP